MISFQDGSNLRPIYNCALILLTETRPGGGSQFVETNRKLGRLRGKASNKECLKFDDVCPNNYCSPHIAPAFMSRCNDTSARAKYEMKNKLGEKKREFKKQRCG